MSSIVRDHPTDYILNIGTEPMFHNLSSIGDVYFFVLYVQIIIEFGRVFQSNEETPNRY